MGRDVRWYDLVTFNIYYLGLTVLAQTMAPLVLPLLVQQFVGETQQGAYFGMLRLWGLMMALLAQSLMGMLSDRCTSRIGRRRPFILGGTLAALVMIVGIGFSAEMGGMAGLWFLLAMYVLQQLSANTAQSAEQSLIPDLVPEDKRGLFSGVKALFEVPIPIVLVSFIIAPLIASANLWGALFVLMGILIATMAVTMFVPDCPLTIPPPALDWRAIVRLLLMTGVFTAIILLMGAGVKGIGHLMAGVKSSAVLFVVMGLSGFVAMAIAVIVGVGSCFRISVGREASERASSFIWWVISRLAFLVGVTNLAGFVLYFLQARLGYTRETAAEPASQMMIFVGAFILLSALPAGWLTDKFGRKQLVAISGLVATLGTVITLLAANLTAVFVGGCIIGLATGIFYTASWALGTSLVPPREAGRYLGLSNLAGAGAGAVGAYIGGPVADFFTTYVPDSPGLGYVLIFAIYGLLFLLSVGLLVKVEEP